MTFPANPRAAAPKNKLGKLLVVTQSLTSPLCLRDSCVIDRKNLVCRYIGTSKATYRKYGDWIGLLRLALSCLVQGTLLPWVRGSVETGYQLRPRGPHISHRLELSYSTFCFSPSAHSSRQELKKISSVQ